MLTCYSHVCSREAAIRHFYAGLKAGCALLVWRDLELIESVLHPAGNSHRREAEPHLVEQAAASTVLEVQQQGSGAVSLRTSGQARCGINRPGGADGHEQLAAIAAARVSPKW